jgi:hypothetical protein
MDGLHKRHGYWCYRQRVADGRIREFSTRTKDYREAMKIRAEAVRLAEAGQLPTDVARWPLERAAQTWLEDRRLRVAPKTHQSDRERLRQAIIARLREVGKSEDVLAEIWVALDSMQLSVFTDMGDLERLRAAGLVRAVVPIYIVLHSRLTLDAEPEADGG